MQINRLNPEDLDKWSVKIQALIKETMAYNFSESELDDAYYQETMIKLKKFLDNNQAVVFLAIEGSQVFGFAWCHEIVRLEKCRLHIANFAVDANKRKKGIGTKLMSEIESYAQEQEYDGLDLLVTASNQMAVEFYLKNGFETERLLLKKEF